MDATDDPLAKTRAIKPKNPKLRADLSADTRLEMFWLMMLARRTDERAWALHRQGKIAFHISAIGQEAAQVGAAFAINRGLDWVAPYYRDLALMLAMGMTPTEFFMGLFGKRDEPNSGGRQMPSHWGLKRANVISHSSPVATQAPHAAGIGLAIKLRHEDKIVLTTIGEGSTSQGEWYEAVNFAAIHALPVIFLVQNNQYAISERVDKQMNIKSVADKACGLGLVGVSVDGTDIYEVYRVVKEAVERGRTGVGPTVVEARTYRITPHSSDDDDRSYRSREEVEEHKKRDPLIVAREILEKDGSLKPGQSEEMDARARSLVDEAVKDAEAAPLPAPEEGMHPVYAEEAPHD
ncbi:MAG: thiamine pyrophosphate-dependent dehydrogenase E1 component subunit alpha [Anaerolineaceae bacterium]|nr:thiamine pyrophosphate-dependent dehydrogenase E1 component subunit alpha [Anaerolineaceae bacterium]